MLLATLHAREAIAFVLHLELRDEAFTDADEAARKFGIRPLGDKWRRIDRKKAVEVLFALLIEDMAFSSPRLSEDDARSSSAEFLSAFSEESTFYTNGNWEAGWTKSGDGLGSFGPAWEPATGATFDGGVLALSRDRSGILWLEDED